MRRGSRFLAPDGCTTRRTSSWRSAMSAVKKFVPDRNLVGFLVFQYGFLINRRITGGGGNGDRVGTKETSDDDVMGQRNCNFEPSRSRWRPGKRSAQLFQLEITKSPADSERIAVAHRRAGEENARSRQRRRR